MIKFKDRYILGNPIRQVIFKILEYASISLPDFLGPVLRPVYKQVTRIPLVQRIIWGSTSRDRCHRYWANPVDDTNSPITYFHGGMLNSAFVLGFIKKYTGNKDAKILEIGCNVGRNLWTLYEAGYRNLSGIEINSEAVELMRVKFPDMVKGATIYNSPVEDMIKSIPDNSYDLVFTMAVLEHIHKDSNWIFREIARITRTTLITLEDEVAVSWRTFARDYQEVFEEAGMRQVEFNDCFNLPEWYGSCKLRVFSK